MRRAPAVAGQFYQGSASGLRRQVGSYMTEGLPREKAIGIVSPHAGLMYSGHVAGAVYSRIETPDTFLLIGPNHTGHGARLSVMTSGEWEIPTGVFGIDDVLAASILDRLPGLTGDSKAHLHEHSLEVQLPFIAHLSGEAKIVPVTVMMLPLEDCARIGDAIAAAVREAGGSVVIVASSDMSHYVSDPNARRIDSHALDRIVALDPEGLYRTVLGLKISMCGVIPVTILLYASKALGAKEARLVKYATSGEVSGDLDHVVGYAGVIVK